jgi:hypothetical protein
MRQALVIAIILIGMVSQAHAVGISSWGVPQLTGYCHDDTAGDVGLPCLVETGDVLDSPLGGTVTVSQPPVDDPERVRAAIYDGTGVDPGPVFEIAKMEDDGSNGANGFTVYDESFDTTDVAGNISLGYFRYTGTQNATHLVVKGANEWGVWDLTSLPTITHSDGLEYYKWDWTSPSYANDWVGVWDTIDNAMSHITLYGTFDTTIQVPLPDSLLLMLGGLLGLRHARRQQRAAA